MRNAVITLMLLLASQMILAQNEKEVPDQSDFLNQQDLELIGINTGSIEDDPMEERSHFGSNVEINFKRGEGAKKDNSPEYFPTILVLPKDLASYNLGFERRPDFTWKNEVSDAEFFEFRLFKDDQVVYKKKTKGTFLKHNAAIEKVYQKFSDAENSQFYWEITTRFRGRKSIVSPQKSFVLRNTPGQFHDIFDIECRQPYFNLDGSVNYTAKIEIKHTSNSSSPLEILSGGIQLTDGILNSISIQNLNSCSPPTPVSYPINIPQGVTEVYCFDFTVQSGQTILLGKVEGEINGILQVSQDENNLPPCVCEICDDGYILHTNEGKIITSKSYNQTDGSSIFQVASDFLLPTSQPIREVKAEVVSVQHLVNDPQCHTCTKNHSRMGMFFDKGRNIIFNPWPGSHSNGVISNMVFDAPFGSTQYSNEVIWMAPSAVSGVDMTTQSVRILNQIAMPQLSSLDCCNSKFQVCIRYTFTDIDCTVCSKVICYELDTDPNASGNGNGGLGTGTGSQQNQSDRLTPNNQ